MPPTEGDHGADDETPDDLRTRDPEAPGAGAVDDDDAAGDVPEPNEPA